MARCLLQSVWLRTCLARGRHLGTSLPADWVIWVDSTVVRAHHHAAGTRTDPPPAPGPKGPQGWNTRRDAAAEPGRPRGGGDVRAERLSRSRGGFISKLHLSADGRCCPLSLIVAPGQRADCTQFKPVLGKIRVPRPGLGRPRKKPDSLAAAGLRQRSRSRVPATAGNPPRDPGEDRRPDGPPAQRCTRGTAARL
ncbi:transposase [Streptomyces sp. NPDC002057]|uniref:transposase n=1 Tax=Streptomyces sp. NPDC002057 TaxID=3154664 RepID=UPI00331B7359